MGRIFLGLIMVAVGAVITLKANWLYENAGAIPWAEDHLGAEGGSRLMYKLIGIGMSVVGFLVMTNMAKSIIIGIFSNLIPGMRQPPGSEL